MIAGVTGAFSAAGSSAVNTATSAYNSAPDLGVTRTAQTAYQNAPDLGIGSRLGVNGTGDQGSSSEEQVSHGASHSSGGSTEASHGGAKAVQDAHEARLQKSRESGRECFLPAFDDHTRCLTLLDLTLATHSI